jgi:hypothetical protein
MALPFVLFVDNMRKLYSGTHVVCMKEQAVATGVVNKGEQY